MPKANEPEKESPKALPEKIFALWRAASTDEARPSLGVVRIEPGAAMATDGHMILKIIPAEKFNVKEPFTVDAEMCAQILKAKGISDEESLINMSNGDGPLQLSVGKYSFLPASQLEMFKYESVLEQKSVKIGEIGFSVSTLEKFIKALKALGVNFFRMEIAGEHDPVKIEAQIDGMDRVTGAVMPARV